MDLKNMLNAYAAQYGPEAGPWNLSVVNKYLEYKITAFFEENVPIEPNANLCNIGIGPGRWDRYLSYKLAGGALTSIDLDEACCRQLREGLALEKNPNPVEVICSDAMQLPLEARFQIVTLIGSTLQESGKGLDLLEKAMSFVAPGGSLYFQTLDGEMDIAVLMETARRQGMVLSTWEQEETYGLSFGYYQFTKSME